MTHPLRLARPVLAFIGVAALFFGLGLCQPAQAGSVDICSEKETATPAQRIEACSALLPHQKTNEVKAYVQLHLGRAYEAADNLESAMRWYGAAAELGSIHALDHLATLEAGRVDCIECQQRALKYRRQAFAKQTSEDRAMRMALQIALVAIRYGGPQDRENAVAELDAMVRHSNPAIAVNASFLLADFFEAAPELPDRDRRWRALLEYIYHRATTWFPNINCSDRDLAGQDGHEFSVVPQDSKLCLAIRDLRWMRSQGFGGPRDASVVKDVIVAKAGYTGVDDSYFEKSSREFNVRVRHPKSSAFLGQSLYDLLNNSAYFDLDVVLLSASAPPSAEQLRGLNDYFALAAKPFSACSVGLRQIRYWHQYLPDDLSRPKKAVDRDLWFSSFREYIVKTLAKSFNPSGSGNPVLLLYDGDIVFSAFALYDYGILVSSKSAVIRAGSARTVAHELGHVFGLHHPPTPDLNLMGYNVYESLLPEGSRLLPVQCNAVRAAPQVKPVVSAFDVPPKAPYAGANERGINAAYEHVRNNLQTFWVLRGGGHRARVNACDLTYLERRFGLTRAEAEAVIGFALNRSWQSPPFLAARDFTTEVPSMVEVETGNRNLFCRSFLYVDLNEFGAVESLDELTDELPHIFVQAIMYNKRQLARMDGKLRIAVGDTLDEKALRAAGLVVQEPYSENLTSIRYLWVGNDIFFLNARRDVVIDAKYEAVTRFEGDWLKAELSPSFPSIDDDDLSYQIPERQSNCNPSKMIQMSVKIPALLPCGRVPGIQQVTSEQAWHLLKSQALAGKPALVVAATYDYPEFHLPTAVNFSDFSGSGSATDLLQSELAQKLKALRIGKGQPILVYGNPQNIEGGEAWDELNLALRFVALGYTNVYWLRSSILHWVMKGLPVAPLAGVSKKH